MNDQATIAPIEATTNWQFAARFSRALFDGLHAGRDGPWFTVPDADQLQIHGAAVDRLARVLVGEPAFVRMARTDPGLSLRPVGPSDRYDDRHVVSVAINQTLIAWGSPQEPGRTPARLALQFAAADEFDIEPWLARTLPTYLGDGRELHRRYGEGLRAFLRAVYEDTQTWLRKQAIDRALLWRGMAQTVTPGFTRGPVQLQPLSSFSTDPDTARVFAEGLDGVLLCTEVPAERIVAVCRHGVGLMASSSAVVLAGPGAVWRLAWSRGAAASQSSAERFRTLAERHVAREQGGARV